MAPYVIDWWRKQVLCFLPVTQKNFAVVMLRSCELWQCQWDF